jgi:YidC/Oxa1 family membrane protein insertase
MFGWNHVVGGLAALLCTLAQAYGGNLGWAIITISVLVRLALLPITLRMARHAHAQQKILLKLKDEIAALKKKYRTKPEELARAMQELYRKHGIKPLDGNLLGGALQFLVGAGLYSAIRRGACPGGSFFWIRNLAQPNALLVLLTAAITFVASALGPHLPEQSRILTSVIPALMTIFLAWRLSSAVVLYWAASAAMGGVQGVMVRRSGRESNA